MRQDEYEERTGITNEKRLIKDESVRKIFADVFDNATMNVIHDLARKKYFEEIEFVLATGKEGNVFRCKSGEEHFALKIYKIETSDFRHMIDYIQGDERFKDVRKDKLEIVKAWTKKEYRNLEEFTKARIRVPLPIASSRNCLVMEFIGKDGVLAPKAKEKPFSDMKKQYEILCEYMAKMVSTRIVHADLSEYNILNNDEELVVIDVGQAVSTLHPKAKEFFERDVLNMSKWFSKHGVDTDYDRMYQNIKLKSAQIDDAKQKKLDANKKYK
ncbi:MAG: serine protein kinase RIO [archaeon]